MPWLLASPGHKQLWYRLSATWIFLIPWQYMTLNIFKDCHSGYTNLKIYSLIKFCCSHIFQWYKKLRSFNSHVGYKISRYHSPEEFFMALAIGLLLKSNTALGVNFNNLWHFNFKEWCKEQMYIYRQISNIRHPIPKLECSSSRLAVVFVQSIEARCQDKNEDVVGAAPTGNAPTISEWSTMLLPVKVRLILEVWRYLCFLQKKFCMTMVNITSGSGEACGVAMYSLWRSSTTASSSGGGHGMSHGGATSISS